MMDDRKWFVAFAGLASLSVFYYFVIFLPGERTRDRDERKANELAFYECLGRAGQAEDAFHRRNGELSEDGTHVHASPLSIARGEEIRKDAEQLCGERFPAAQR